MPITSFTTFDEIRAALGVSATELPDSIIGQEQYSTLAVLDLEAVNSGIPALYSTIFALPEANRSAAEQRYYLLVRLFITYAIARNLLTSLPLFSVSRLSDGRAEFTRQPDIFEDVRLGVQGMFNTLRTKLTTSYVGLAPLEEAYKQASFNFTVSTGLGLDPVTNA
jgi:hypothetical protein